MLHSKFTIPFLFICLISAQGLEAQATASASKPDVLILTDGEKLIGHLQSSSGSSVVFKSDIVGDVTVDWSKIQELHSSQTFAAVPKGVKLRGSQDESKVPQGTVEMTDQKLQVTPSTGAQPRTIPTNSVANLVQQPAFQKAFQHESFAKGWTGGATLGLSFTEATQKNQTVTSALSLVRPVPSVNWLDLRSRTIFDYNQAYGKLSEPGSPTVKTSLFHIGAEQDWYLSSRLFVFGQALFDHNVSQGLDLQQTYGGGLGFVAFKTDIQELDFKASMDYIDQRFTLASLNKQLIGSVFSEGYNRKFAHGILFAQQAGITPAWNNTDAYSAFASAALTFPVYHRFGLTVGALDNFLNDPPPTFKKNSFQFTLGATYLFP
ncbi:MAG TPA: DUF481 domain-containing protein [Bryobacteraceae bacterium]|nr:DUF481 domain-containing protein [Bryobacteraceae bacterium]